MTTPPPQPQHVAVPIVTAQAINDGLELKRLELLAELKVVEGQIAALRNAEPVLLTDPTPPTEGELEAQVGQGTPPPGAIEAGIAQLEALRDAAGDAEGAAS